MIGWGIAAAVICLFLITKVGVRLKWESGEAKVKIRIGFIRFSLSTREDAHKKAKKSKQDTSAAPVKKKKLAWKPWVKSLLSNWRSVLAFVSKVLRTPNMELLRLHIAVGDREPDVCAMNYGRICAGLSVALPVLQKLFSIKKQDVSVSCHFEANKTDITAETEVTARVYQLLTLLFAGLSVLLKLYRRTKSYEKAVQPQ